MKYLKIFIVAMLFITRWVQAQYSPQDGIYPDWVFQKNIKTARIFKAGWETSYPITHIDDTEPMVLQFDELTENAQNYSYMVIHCDADWRQSRLATDEYMSGFPTNFIRSYAYSFNTQVQYVHYELPIPNEDIQLKLSGNYVVVVYEEGREDKPLMCRRFSIAEKTAAIMAEAGSARQTAYHDQWQQLDFVVRTAGIRIDNAHTDVKVVILQNGQWYAARTGVRPLFIRQNELDYRYTDKTLLFAAGNEYRPLDLQNRRFSSTGGGAMEFRGNTWHFFPPVDEPREVSQYIFVEELNGKYAVREEKASRPEIEADYVLVHFALHMHEPIENATVYVAGDFSCNSFTGDNRMTWNAEKSQYEAHVLLKQGYYNYMYMLAHAADDENLEGNFHDTENDYTVYVYYRGRATRYDRLIGVTTVNTLKK